MKKIIVTILIIVLFVVSVGLSVGLFIKIDQPSTLPSLGEGIGDKEPPISSGDQDNTEEPDQDNTEKPGQVDFVTISLSKTSISIPYSSFENMESSGDSDLRYSLAADVFVNGEQGNLGEYELLIEVAWAKDGLSENLSNYVSILIYEEGKYDIVISKYFLNDIVIKISTNEGKVFSTCKLHCQSRKPSLGDIIGSA